MQLWTVWVDYGATGEGLTLLARVAYAKDEQSALMDRWKARSSSQPSGGALTELNALIGEALRAAHCLHRPMDAGLTHGFGGRVHVALRHLKDALRCWGIAQTTGGGGEALG